MFSGMALRRSISSQSRCLAGLVRAEQAVQHVAEARSGGSRLGCTRKLSQGGGGMMGKLQSLFSDSEAESNPSRPLLKGRKPVLLGKVSRPRPVPPIVTKPNYAVSGRLPRPEKMIYLHGEESRAKMRAAGQLARKMLDYACSLARVGVSTDEIDAAVHKAIVDHGAYPSPLNYGGFPKSICSSVNEVVIHGIPDDRKLEDGDVAKFDISLYLDGVHGDNCATVCVGQVDEEGWRLVEGARKALDEAVKQCKPGGCLSDIGDAVQGVAEEYGLSSVQAYSGHGIGHHLHMFPFVLHYRNNEKIPLRPGMIFTIEPMLVEGRAEVEVLEDGWTVISRDGGRGAQFEHTVLITDEGAEVLTSLDGGARAAGSLRQ